MKDPAKERWLELCHLAIHEQDPDKFLSIVQELDQLLNATESSVQLKSQNGREKANAPASRPHC